MSGAADRWREELATWAIPDELLAAAPESPWGCDPGRFADRARRAAERPSRASEVVIDALEPGDRLLDVGCGGGAASLPAAPPAGALVGVDQSPGMLARYTSAADERGVEVETVEGSWPDVAPATPTGDVAVMQDVLYNLPDIDASLAALTERARRRVVVALPDRHPLTWLTPYWRTLHGLERPRGPTADDAFAVAADLGLEPTLERVAEPSDPAWHDPDHLVPELRRRLCATAADDERIAALARRFPPPRHRLVVVLSWRGAG